MNHNFEIGANDTGKDANNARKDERWSRGFLSLEEVVDGTPWHFAKRD